MGRSGPMSRRSLVATGPSVVAGCGDRTRWRVKEDRDSRGGACMFRCEILQGQMELCEGACDSMTTASVKLSGELARQDSHGRTCLDKEITAIANRYRRARRSSVPASQCP